MRQIARALPERARRTPDFDFRSAVLAGGALALAVGGCVEDDVHVERAAISAGQLAPEESAVVVVRNVATGALCSATRIAPRVVVTAKHCVQEAERVHPQVPAAFSVGVVAAGLTSEAQATWVPVVSVRAMAGAFAPPPLDAADLAGRDIAVLVVEPDEATEQPAPLGATLPRVGDSLRAVGFGSTADRDNASAGVRRSSTVAVRGVMGSIVATTAAACAGDSGGPLWDARGALVGVISLQVGDCEAGETQATLITAARELIDEALCEAHGACDGEAWQGEADQPDTDDADEGEAMSPPPAGCSAVAAPGDSGGPVALCALALAAFGVRRPRGKGDTE